MDNNKGVKPEVFQSREFLEKARILEMEKEVIELRHKNKTEELHLERKLHHEEHKERMTEIRLKNANIRRSIDEKDRLVREHYEKKQQRFARINNGEPIQYQEETS